MMESQTQLTIVLTYATLISLMLMVMELEMSVMVVPDAVVVAVSLLVSKFA